MKFIYVTRSKNSRRPSNFRLKSREDSMEKYLNNQYYQNFIVGLKLYH